MGEKRESHDSEEFVEKATEEFNKQAETPLALSNKMESVTLEGWLKAIKLVVPHLVLPKR